MPNPPIDPRELSGLDPKAAERFLDLKKKPITPSARRDTTKYPDMVPEARMNELVGIMGEIGFEASREIGSLLMEYQKKWRMADHDVIEAIHTVADTVLTQQDKPDMLSEEHKKTQDTFRAMQAKYQARLTTAQLLDAKVAGELVADIVHNQFVAKEQDVSESQARNQR